MHGKQQSILASFFLVKTSFSPRFEGHYCYRYYIVLLRSCIKLLLQNESSTAPWSRARGVSFNLFIHHSRSTAAAGLLLARAGFRASVKWAEEVNIKCNTFRYALTYSAVGHCALHLHVCMNYYSA